MLAGVWLAEDSPDDLLHVNCRCLVRKRREDVRERAVPPFLEGVDGYDVPYRTVLRHQVNRLQLVLVRRLYGYLLRRNAHVDELRLYLIERRRVVAVLRLCLKEDNRPDILIIYLRLLFQHAAQLHRIVYDARPVRAVVHDHRQLHHVLPLQFARVGV